MRLAVVQLSALARTAELHLPAACGQDARELESGTRLLTPVCTCLSTRVHTAVKGRSSHENCTHQAMADFVQHECANSKASPGCSASRSLCRLQLVACSLYTTALTLHRAVPVFRDQVPRLLPSLPVTSSRCA